MALDSLASSFVSHAAQVHDIIVVGASAGGVEALADFASRLPAGLPAAVFIVLHMPAYGHSVLPDILNWRGLLPASHPKDGEAVKPGRIYVAPPDHHLLVKEGRILLSRGPAENNHRPAVDALFRAAARAYGPRVVGVVLTGTLDDGTAGLQAIKMRGGLALVQDPAEAMFAGMPRSAMENVAVDAVQPLAVLAETVVRLAGTAAQEGRLVPPELEEDVAASEMRPDALEDRTQGKPSGFSCPDCHGVLWEIAEGDLFASAAGSAMRFLRKACSHPSPPAWKKRSGWRSGHWKKAHRWRSACRSARRSGAMCCRRSGSPSRRLTPGPVPALSTGR